MQTIMECIGIAQNIFKIWIALDEYTITTNCNEIKFYRLTILPFKSSHWKHLIF